MTEIGNTIYTYNYVHRVVVKTTPLCNKRNMPMHKKPVKLHKGIDNTTYFRVLDTSNKPHDLCDSEVRAKCFNIATKEQMFDVPCNLLTQPGVVALETSESLLSSIPAGFYKLVLVSKDNTTNELKPLYSDFDENIEFTVDITEQGQMEPFDSTVIDEWTMVQVDSVDSYISDAVPSSRISNTLHNLHSFSVYADNYTGTLEVFATLDLTPETDLTTGWVQIPVMGLDEDYIQFNNFSGTRLFTFSGNYMWIKFRYTPEDGSIDKLIVRS